MPRLADMRLDGDQMSANGDTPWLLATDRETTVIHTGLMTRSAPHVLLIVRHAKAVHEQPVSDHDRPLSQHGRRDAPALGRWLAAAVGVPGLVLCSSALRAQQTWELAAAELERAPVVQVRPDLYLASPGTVLAAVRAVSADVRAVVVVGHEPTQSTLAHALAGPGSRRQALTALAAGFSTNAVAVLETDGPWEALQPRGARLTAFAVPRG